MKKLSSSKHHLSFTPATLSLIFAGLCIVIILISILGIILRGNDEITILNESEANSALLSEADLARVKKELFSTLKTVTNTDANQINVYVRWDSLSQTDQGRTTFLIDVDDYQQTYLVSLDEYQVLLSCPDLALSKYPNSFCVANDGEYNDSISVVFGDELPLTAQTSQGETFEIVRSEVSGGEWNRDLAIWIFSCPASDALTARVSAAVDDFILSRGASPSAFTKKFYHMPCDSE